MANQMGNQTKNEEHNKIKIEKRRREEKKKTVVKRILTDRYP